MKRSEMFFEPFSSLFCFCRSFSFLYSSFVFDSASLLIAADCTASVPPAVYRDFIRGRITLIGRPKLDERESFVSPRSSPPTRSRILPFWRWGVPCCSSLEAIVCQALKTAGKEAPVKSVILGIEGEVQG